VTICTDDVICGSTAASGRPGCPSKHVNYEFDVDGYADDARGQWCNGQFLPWN
jgi:cutinase